MNADKSIHCIPPLLYSLRQEVKLVKLFLHRVSPYCMILIPCNTPWFYLLQFSNSHRRKAHIIEAKDVQKKIGALLSGTIMDSLSIAQTMVRPISETTCSEDCSNSAAPDVWDVEPIGRTTMDAARCIELVLKDIGLLVTLALTALYRGGRRLLPFVRRLHHLPVAVGFLSSYSRSFYLLCRIKSHLVPFIHQFSDCLQGGKALNLHPVTLEHIQTVESRRWVTEKGGAGMQIGDSGGNGGGRGGQGEKEKPEC